MKDTFIPSQAIKVKNIALRKDYIHDLQYYIHTIYSIYNLHRVKYFFYKNTP